MLRDSPAYDRVLETVSHAVNARVRYYLEKDASLVLENAREAEGALGRGAQLRGGKITKPQR
jgi:hypothetical protein